MILAPLLVLSACGEPVVASLELAGELLTHKLGRVVLDARALDADGRVLPDVPILAVSVADETVARVGRDGSLACEAQGTTQVKVKAGKVTRDFELRCLLISAVKPAHKTISLEAGSDQGYPLQWTVLDLAGRPVEGVPVDLTSADPSIARVEGLKVFGVSSGRSTLTWSAGEVSAQVGVRVGRVLLKHQGLIVPEAGVDLDLRSGEWTVTISAQEDVTVEVFDGRCSETKAQKVHHLVCRPEGDVKMHIEPTGLLREPTTAHVRGVFYPAS